MKIQQIFKHLMTELKPYGALHWHTSQFRSAYIKFRDTRIGSIRISDHSGRQKYSYTWDLVEGECDQEKLDLVVAEIKEKAGNINNFDPEKFVVFNKDEGQYITLDTRVEYDNYILRKG